MNSMSMFRRLGLAIAAAVFGAPASAEPFTMTDILSTGAFIDVNRQSGPPQVYSSQAQSWDFGSTVNDSGMSASATNSGFVDYGTVRMRLDAVASRNLFEPGCPVGLQGPGCDQYGTHLVGADAQGVAMWQDYVTLTSNTLPLGTPVDVEVGYLLHSSAVSFPGDAWCQPGQGPGGLSILGFANVWFGGWSFQRDGCGSGTDYMSGTAVGHLKVGDGFAINAGLQETVEAISTNWGLTNEELADASDTTYFTINVLTPGAQYVSDSGTVYLTSFPSAGQVPEPASLELAGLGLGLLVALSVGRIGVAKPYP